MPLNANGTARISPYNEVHEVWHDAVHRLLVNHWALLKVLVEFQENSHEDTAYGNEAIGVHTDGTYFEQTPGIQVCDQLQRSFR